MWIQGRSQLLDYSNRICVGHYVTVLPKWEKLKILEVFSTRLSKSEGSC